MRIDNDIKLDYKDVLIRPKRSTLKSRSQVDVTRTYTFKHSQCTWTGVPIIAANMDTVGTFEMARALASHGVITAVHKHYSIDDWKQFGAAYPLVLPYVCVSAGTSDDDFNKLATILSALPEVHFICLDVANGYSEHFVAFVRYDMASSPSPCMRMM
jgi:GMP reductase